jgi:protein-L-isoaspartate(D-aspartate) O-methyltransferase
MVMEPSPPKGEHFAALRQEMVEQQIRRRGISDRRVLEAMTRVPRHEFVDRGYLEEAYEDHPLPIGCGQTISQPFMVARMTELCALSPEDRVLEVGAGSGYQSAILAALCQQVYATEIVEDLVSKARRALEVTGCENVLLELRDGSKGWREHAPYDAVLVAAGAPEVPDPLKEQLADGGRLVIPVGGRGLQILKCITRRGDAFETSADTACRFVDLRGEHGWSGSR